MHILHFISDIFREDLGFLNPKSSERLTREIAVRLIFYIAFILFILRLFTPALSSLISIISDNSYKI